MGKYDVGNIIEHGNNKYEILEYLNRNYRKVRILNTGTVLPRLHTWQLTTGEIKDPNKPNVYGVGYMGQGKYNSISGIGKKAYKVWSGMIERCYSENYHARSSYFGRGITVCKEWLNFQRFTEWFEKNYVEGFELDKDILSGKVYSPDTCVFIPKPLNTFFTNRRSCRGKYPIGVSYHGDSTGKFAVNLCDGAGQDVYLGIYETPAQAFLVYKENKEMLCKKYAEKYYDEGCISEDIYKRLMQWTVSIDD